MKVIAIVAPVLCMILLGMFCKKKQILTTTGIENIKKYITEFALPVTIFHAIATAKYNKSTIIILLIMLGVMIICYFFGVLTKGVIKNENLKKYYPFLMTAYEGGMLGYPLYQNLCGNDKLSNIAVVDMAGCIFTFAFIAGMIELIETNKKANPKELAITAFKNNAFRGMLLGLVLGVTGLMTGFMECPVAEVYVGIKDIVTAPLSAMILLVVGYNFSLDRKIVGMCIKSGVIRVILQAAFLVGVIFVLKPLKLDTYMITAFCIYFFATPSFGVVSYVKNQEGNKYISTTVSLYCVVTMIAYAVVAYFYLY